MPLNVRGSLKRNTPLEIAFDITIMQIPPMLVAIAIGHLPFNGSVLVAAAVYILILALMLIPYIARDKV